MKTTSILNGLISIEQKLIAVRSQFGVDIGDEISTLREIINICITYRLVDLTCVPDELQTHKPKDDFKILKERDITFFDQLGRQTHGTDGKPISENAANKLFSAIIGVIVSRTVTSPPRTQLEAEHALKAALDRIVFSGNAS